MSENNQFDEIYGSPWIKVPDLNGEKKKFQVGDAAYEEVGHGQNKKKLAILSLVDEIKRCILNPTNARSLAASWGKDEKLWPGNWVEISEIMTSLGPGLCVRATSPPITALLTDDKPLPADEVPSGDDIPF